MKIKRRLRAAPLAAAAVGTVLLGQAVAAPASAAPAGTNPAQTRSAETATNPVDEVPSFDFGACPELPADADPAAWRCEVMVAVGGRLKLGAIDQEITEPIRITFAEGRVNGEARQVFGELQAEAVPVTGLAGRRGPRLWIRPQYAGYSDFQSNKERRGEINLTFALSGPMLPETCGIGDDADPARLVLHDRGPMRVVSDEPPVRAFGVEDVTFEAPGTKRCGTLGGTLGKLLDRRLALPAPAGESQISFDAYYTFRTYDMLPQRTR